jgi:hypothetical protein
MSLTFKLAPGCEKTGTLLQQLVGSAQGAKAGVVCWGRGHNGPEPTLNGRASMANKLQQLQKFKDAGILTVPFYEKLPSAASEFPILGRNLKHHGGTDIALLMQPDDMELPWIRKKHPDFFTGWVPRKTEYRCWVYRRRHLATYEKRRVRPEESKPWRVGANHKDGYAFLLMNSELVPEGIREIAAKAVDCLGLDFGAVDILRGIDNALYVLETNTSPGAESADRAGLKSLAAKISNWAKLGCPRRNGDKME